KIIKTFPKEKTKKLCDVEENKPESREHPIDGKTLKMWSNPCGTLPVKFKAVFVKSDSLAKGPCQWSSVSHSFAHCCCWHLQEAV
ncbi:hypothetical protein ACXWO4_10445, partial [Streptococcus pyogenes]